jgi:hypothetical protein
VPTVPVTCRIDADLLDALNAVSRGSRSAFVRDAVLAHLARSGVTIGERQPRARRAPTHHLPVDVQELRRLWLQTRMTGGSVIQLCQALREGGHPSHPDAEAVLSALYQVSRQLQTIVKAIASP